MRTTLQLDDQIFKAVKKYAAEHHKTFTAVVQDALQFLLASGKKTGASETVFQIPTFKGDGLRPGVDLDDTSSLLDLMQKDDSPRR